MSKNERTNFNRRNFLKLGGTAAGLGALGLTGMSVMQPARAAERRVVIGTWGGDYNRTIQETVTSAVRKSSDIDLVSLVGSADSRRTQLLVGARSGQNNMDLACLSDLDMHMLNQQHALADVAEDEVHNIAHVYPQFVRPYAIPHIYSAMVIVYNKNKVSKPPKSIKDLWSDEFAGKVGLSDILYKYFIPLIAAAFGGNEQNFKPGMDALMELKKKGVSVFPSNEAIANAFKSGEITATLMWRARAFQWQEAGLSVASVVPDEGSLPVIFEIGMTPHARDPKASATVLNRFLSPDSQIEFAKVMGYVPTVDNAKLPDDLQKNIGFTDAQRENFVHTDYDYAVSQLGPMMKWWNREFKG